MSNQSVVVISPGPGGSSSFSFSVDGAPLRTTTYADGVVTIPAVTAPIDIPLPAFEWLVGEFLRWSVDVARYVAPPKVAERLFAVDFLLGNLVIDTYRCAVTAEFGEVYGGSVTFGFTTPPSGPVVVTFVSRPEAHISWTSFTRLNLLARELTEAILTGKRPVNLPTLNGEA